MGLTLLSECLLKLLDSHACLPKNPPEQRVVNLFGAMWIRNSETELALDHDPMPSTGFRPFKPQILEGADEFPGTDGQFKPPALSRSDQCRPPGESCGPYASQ